MTEAQSPSSPAPQRSGKSPYFLIGVIVLVFLAYQLAMGMVRKHVDEQIESNVGEFVVAFELRDLDDVLWKAEDLRGKKVVLNFFRSYCQSCEMEKRTIRELADTVDPEKVVVLGVMVDEVEGFPPEVTQSTLVKFGYRHPILMADSAFVDHFHGAGWARVTPVTYIIDEAGKISASLRGHQSLEVLRKAIG